MKPRNETKPRKARKYKNETNPEKPAEKLLRLLRDLSVKAYTMFLEYTLIFLNDFNALFQTQTILIYQMTELSFSFLTQIGENFLQPEFFMEVLDIDVDDPNYCVPLNSVCLGTECEDYLKDFSPGVVQAIRETCLKFYRTAVKGMDERFSMNESLLSNLKFLVPELALQERPRAEIPDLSDIAACYYYQRFSMKKKKNFEKP